MISVSHLRKSFGGVEVLKDVNADPTMVGEVLAVIKDLVKTGMTMLVVTHGKAARFVDILGKMLADGVIDDEESKRISLILSRL